MLTLDKDFWETKHTVNDGWLTGTNLSRLVDFFNLSTYTIINKKVLEVGIGFGHSARGLAKLASEFYGSDISEKALSKISNCATGVFLTTDLSQCPPVDIAFCHLVLVHCSDAEALRIINDINLTSDGKAYLQFSSMIGEPTNRIKADLIDNGSHFFRSLDQVKAMIAKSNKEIVNIEPPIDPSGFHDYGLKQEWHFVTVKNK